VKEVEKSRKKTGGRQKGTKNVRSTVLSDLLEIKYPSYNPVLAMAEIAHDKTQDMTMRFNAHKEVAKYTNHQLKAVEVSGELDAAVAVQQFVLKDGQVMQWGGK
jgi:hypothetical protein